MKALAMLVSPAFMTIFMSYLLHFEANFQMVKTIAHLCEQYYTYNVLMG